MMEKNQLQPTVMIDAVPTLRRTRLAPGGVRRSGAMAIAAVAGLALGAVTASTTLVLPSRTPTQPADRGAAVTPAVAPTPAPATSDCSENTAQPGEDPAHA